MSRHICVSPPLNLCKYVWQQRVKCLETCILGRSLNFCSISSFVLPLAKWILSGVHIVNACCHLSLSCIHVALEWITNSSGVYLLCYDKMWTRLHFCCFQNGVCDGQHILLPVFLIYIDFDWLTAALVFYGGQTCGVDASYAPLK